MAGKLEQVDTSDGSQAGEWSSPAFMVDKVGDVLGRVVMDYDGPKSETEDHPAPPGATQPTSDNLSLPSPNRALSAMREVLTSDPPVPPPKRRPRESNSRRKFKQIKGRIYR